MANTKKRKVIDIVPSSKSKKTKTQLLDSEISKPEYKKPEELDQVFISIESHKSVVTQQLTTEEPSVSQETTPLASISKEFPVKETEISKSEPKEVIDRESFFKELEKELFAQKEIQKSKPKPSIKNVSLVNKKHIKKLILGIFTIGISLGLFYYLGFIVLPKTEIYITAKKINISSDKLDILVDKNISQINPELKTIPGNLFTFSESVTKDFNSTGQGKDDRPAKGTITIINNFSTSPQILIATTRFEHPSGKIYRLDSRIVVPGATMENGKLVPSSIDATVTAQEPGPNYNIEACNNDCKFTIPAFKGTSKYDGFYAISNQPITGGSLGAAPMVTAQDIKNAEQTILDEINKKIEESIQNKIPSGLKIINTAQSSLKINKINSTANTGDYRQTFSMSINGEVDIIAFKEDDIIALIKSLSDPDKPEKYNYCQTTKIEYKEALADFKSGTLKVAISYNQPICYQLNETDIRNAVKGKHQQELNMILNSFDGIEAVKIKLYPFWIKKVPEKDSKIKIFID